MALEITDKNFKEEVLSFGGVTLVDFWAPWCGPCKMQGPIVDQLAEEMKAESKVKISKLNVDENQTTAQEYRVMSIPTLKIFKAGQVVADLVGLQSKEVLKSKIREQL